MSRSSLALAALATVAIPGLEPVTSRGVDSSTDFDVAQVVDARERRWTVKAPRSVISGAAMEGEVALLENLGVEVDNGALPFDVPRPRGFAPLPEGGRAIVFPQIIGHPLNMARLAAIAVKVAHVIASIHALPTRVLEDTGLPTFSAGECRGRRLAELDEAASTGHVPPQLLERWERACEDVRLWRFTPTVVHGDLAPEHILTRDQDVAGVIEWASAHVGDPADDLAPLLAEAPEGAMDRLLESYHAARGVADEYLLARAVLASELALMRWLMHGVRTELPGIVDDAVNMLTELAHETEDADPIATLGGGIEAAPVQSFAAPGSGAIPMGESDPDPAGADAPTEDDTPTAEIPRSDPHA